MINPRTCAIAISLNLAACSAFAGAEVQVLGEMRRMFVAHDIGPNVNLAEVNLKPNLYALGPVAGLAGEITVLNGKVFVSSVGKAKPTVTDPADAKAVFLVYAYVPAWHSSELPIKVISETDLAAFLERQTPNNTRTVFLVQGTARKARYHVVHFTGPTQDLTHEAHDQAKVFYELTDTPVELVGFFTSREGDGGSFVHMGQTTHVHLISKDRSHMGHLESIQLAPGAKLLLPQ